MNKSKIVGVIVSSVALIALYWCGTIDIEDKLSRKRFIKKQDEIVYSTSNFSLSYDPSAFLVHGEKRNVSVTFSYCREDVVTAGANTITISTVKNADAKLFLENKITAMGGNKEDIQEDSIANAEGNCYTYIAREETKESKLIMTKTLYAIANGRDVIYLEQFRTNGYVEESEAIIDEDFEHLIETFHIINLDLTGNDSNS